jgi:hypothetical protein
MTEGNYCNVGHRGPIYKGLGAMNPCELYLYPLKDVSEGKIKGSLEVMGRRESIRKQLLEYLKNRGYSKLKEEALPYNLWNRLVRGYESVVRQANK